jgi:hypothetical protein
VSQCEYSQKFSSISSGFPTFSNGKFKDFTELSRMFFNKIGDPAKIFERGLDFLNNELRFCKKAYTIHICYLPVARSG